MRTKSTEAKLRDEEIVAAARMNLPRRDIARKYGISESRVSQIVSQNLDPRYPDEDLRAWLLEGYFGDLLVLQEIRDGKGRAITSGKGDHIIDATTGEPAFDPSPRIDAVRTAAQVRKNVAQLMGSEKPMPKAEETSSLEEYLIGIREMEERAIANMTLIENLKSQIAALEGSVPAEITE